LNDEFSDSMFDFILERSGGFQIDREDYNRKTLVVSGQTGNYEADTFVPLCSTAAHGIIWSELENGDCIWSGVAGRIDDRHDEALLRSIGGYPLHASHG
jgi:hypothetical protein